MTHGLYDALRSIISPWPMDCTMLFLAMGHGLYNIVQSMAHEEPSSHDPWIVQHCMKYCFSMAHGLYNAIPGHGSWVVQYLFRMGTWDWDGENKQMNQSVQAMRHATAMAMRLHYMIQEQDSNVSILLIVVEEVTDEGDSIRSLSIRLTRPSKVCRTSGVGWLTRYRRLSDRL
jgi:hypothetical protein